MKDYLFPPMNGVSRLFKLTEHASFSVDMLGGIVVLDGYALTLAPLPGYGFFIICGPGTLAGVVELGLTGTQSVQVTIENGVFRFADQPDIDLAALSAALDAATQRANHTGTQPIASVDGLAEALAAAAASGSTVPVIIRTAITGPPLDSSPGVKQSRVIDLTGGTASSVGPVNWYVYSSLGAGSWGGTITVIEGDTDAQAADKVVASMAADAALMVHYSAARVGLTVVVEARVAAAHDEGFGWELEGGYPADAPLASGVAPVAGTPPLSIGQLCRVGPYELTGGRTQAYDWFIAETMTGWRQIDEAQAAVVSNATVNAAIASAPAASRAALSMPEIRAVDYGVVADFVLGTGAGTDNTAALQAAINAAAAAGASQIVWLPPGDIKITAELVVSNRVHLQGHGFSRTRIYATTPGQNGIWINSPLHDDCKFRHFALYGPAGHGGDGVASGVGILCDSKVAPGTYVFGPTEFDGLWVSRWSTCLKLGQMPLAVGKQCYFGGFRLHGIHLVSTDTFQFNACASGYGTEVIDFTSGSPTTIKIEGSGVAPTGTNFAGEFTNCEFGDTWKFLSISGCRAGFESCNFETRGGASGHVTANTLFDILPGARLFFKNCRAGWGSTSVDAAATPAAAVLCDCSNNSAEPRLIVDNTDLAGGLYTLAAKYVGANWAFYNPSVVGNTQLPTKYYNASNVEQASLPTAASMWFSRGHDWFSSNVLTSAWAALRRTQVYLYFVGGGDTTPGDDNQIFVRKTRKKIGGAVQFTRSSMVNDTLMEVLGCGVTLPYNTNASYIDLTPGAPTMGIGTLQGNGDIITMKVRGLFQGTSINAGSFVVGATYRILTVGTTNFTLIGAAGNTVGVEFVATGVGTGTGAAARQTSAAGSFVNNCWYRISTVGTTDFTLIGAANNNVGTVFMATGAGSGTGFASHVKTFSSWINGIETTATRMQVIDAAAHYWEVEIKYHGVLSSTTKVTQSVQAYNMAGDNVCNRMISYDQSGFTSTDFVQTIRGQSATIADIVGHGWDLVWRSNAIKV